MSVRDWLRGLPKAELHVHLEGTVTPELYTRIAKRNGAQIPKDPRTLFNCHDFGSFLNAIVTVVKTLCRPQDFADIAAEYLVQSRQQGVRHVEFMFSPASIRHFHAEADPAVIVTAIHEECRRAKAASGISSSIVFDMVRNLGEDAAMMDIDLAIKCRNLGVTGVGLGGDERRFPARDFARVFERAQSIGLRRTVHAGETGDSASIVDAVELLRAERIGHGVAAAGQPDIQRRLRELKVTIDACPTSNAVTGAWGRVTPHPLEEFMHAGIPVSLSSDDPSFFGCSLLGEYEALAEQGFSNAQLAQIARASFTSSFADEKEKRIWLSELDAYLSQT
ncbi:MAG: adenosine deaminase [Candidatus Eremiobacteraeota bacterium]|nr:adenosine deaminase [Candidatus Eremiobacteraeota bacterium]